MESEKKTIRLPLDENSEQWEIEAAAEMADHELSEDADKVRGNAPEQKN